MSSILHQRCSVELVTYFHACTETCRWPLTPHPWNDHSIPYCQRGVSCSDPTLSYMLSHKSTKNKLLDHLQPTGPKGNPRHSTISQHLSQCRLTCCDGLSTKGENQQMKPWWLEDWLEALMILMFPKRHPRPWAVTLVFAFIVHSCFLLHSCFRIDSTGRFLQISSWVWKPLEKRTGPFLLFPCRSRTISEWWLLQSKKMTDQHPQIWSLLAFMPFLRKQIMPNPDRSPHFHGLCGQSARIGQGGRYLEIIRAVCPVSVKAIISLPQTQLMLAA